jgi:hypothetical protein
MIKPWTERMLMAGRGGGVHRRDRPAAPRWLRQALTSVLGRA